MSFKIAKVVVPLPVEGPFDYVIPLDLRKSIAVGQRVAIMFNRRRVSGVVVDLVQQSDIPKLNYVTALLDTAQPSLNRQALQLTQWMSQAYGCSWGEAIAVYLPLVLRKSRKTKLSVNPVIANVQQECGKLIEQQSINIFCHDQSRKEKWKFLRQKIAEVVTNKRSVIILVPELVIGESIAAELNQKDTLILHKKLPVKQEVEQWLQMQCNEVSVVIGTRSAIFSPLSNVGLIIVYDEEHELFKEEQSPYYDARYVARMRAEIENCSIVFMSSAPSAETWWESHKENWERVTLKEGTPAKVQVVDMSNYNPQKTSILSFPLQNNIRLFLDEKKKIILFMNRRGFAGITRCHQCGYTVKCQRCDVNLTYLHSKNYMMCRHCNFTQELPKICPSCHGNYLRSMGKGIEKLKEEASRLFPQAIVANYDKDNPHFPTYAHIIIATQTILKVKEKKRFDCVTVLNLDAELHHMDYRCAQKTFTLLIQLQKMAKEKLMVQTYMTDNYVLQAVKKGNFKQFYKEELQHRKDLGFPPYQHLVMIRLRGEKEEDVFSQSVVIFEQLKSMKLEDIQVSDPHPDMIPKLRDKYRFCIVLTGEAVKPILALIKQTLKSVKKKRNIIVTIEVEY